MALTGFSSYDGGDDTLVLKDVNSGDVTQVPQATIPGMRKQDVHGPNATRMSYRSAIKPQNPPLGQVQETEVSACADETAEEEDHDQDSETKLTSSDTSQDFKKPDRISLFGRITRSLSGTLHHSTMTDPTHKDNKTSYLSREEQTSRFWSRQRSGSGSSATLLREVEKDIGAGISTPVTAKERSKASQLLVREINKVARLVLQQYCSNGLPLSVDLYPLSKMLRLYEEAFSIGLRPCPLFQPTVPNMYLSDFEKILPRGNATPHSLLLGLRTIYPHEQFGIQTIAEDENADVSSQFQEWLKACLVDSCLGERMESVLKHQEFLKGWYCPQAIVTNEDLIQEIIASCRGLDVISIEGGCKNQTSSSKKSSALGALQNGKL